MTEPLGLQIARAAEAWVGVPFALGGRDRYGLDCLGLLVVVAHGLGLSEEDAKGYSEADGPRRLRAGLSRYCAPVTGDLQPGDIVLLSARGAESHLGLIATDGGLIHAWNHPKAARVVHHRLNAFWRGKITAAFRWKEGAGG